MSAEVDIIAQAKAQAYTGQRRLPNGRKVYNTTAQMQEATRKAFKATHIPAKKVPVPVKKQQVINPRMKSSTNVESNPEEIDEELEEQLEVEQTEDERLQAHMHRARQNQHSNKLSDKHIPSAFAEIANQRRSKVALTKQSKSVKSEPITKPNKDKSPEKSSKKPEKGNKSPEKPSKAKKPIEDDIDINDLEDLQMDDEDVVDKNQKKSTKSDKSTKKPKKEVEEEDNIEVEDESISDVDDELDESTPKKDKIRKSK